MANPQLHPLQVNSRTGEPFLRLNHHNNIILTPHRPTDTICYPPILNDPRVHEWLMGPPIPYLPGNLIFECPKSRMLTRKGIDVIPTEHAEGWFKSVQAYSDAVLSKLEAAKDSQGLITVDECPVRAIREVTANGEEVYLGDIGIQRCTDGKLLAASVGVQANNEEIARYEDENSRRIVGDPEIVWDFGGTLWNASNNLSCCVLTCSLNGLDYLKASHHGRGIMTDAVETLLWRWAVPRMGVRRVLATTFRGNHGSIRVFQKNGFVLTKTLESYLEVRGKIRDFHLLEWDFDTVDKQPSL
jgi:RimJ/RimL family protein N-acetyltransferase